MGRQAEVLVKLDGHCQGTTAQLEADFLRLSAPHHVTVAFSQIESCEAANGWLMLRYGVHRLDLHLGPKAEMWCRAIVSPPTLLDKLGVKPGVSVAAVGFEDLAFLEGVELSEGASDLVLLNVLDAAGLDQVRPSRRLVAQRGGLWVVYPWGSKEIPERLVREVAICDEWVDVKTCRFDETRTALKFVRRR